MNDKDLFVQALAAVWSRLPPLLGARWDDMEFAMLLRLRELEAPLSPQTDDAFDALVELVARDPAVYELVLASYGALLQDVQRGGVRPAPAVGGAVKYERYLEIPVFYGTDRAPAAEIRVEPFFTGDRGEFSYGVARVSVPDDHRLGRLEKPRWWKLQFHQDPARFVLVLGLDPLERDVFIARARDTVHQSRLAEGLLFIHGFNVSFADAARRAAQVAYDLNFEGLTMLYSWPSEGAVLRYPIDRENTAWTLDHFRAFVTLALAELGMARVHVIAHSMGNQVLVNGLAHFVTSALPPGSAQLEQLILAAPDLDADVFRGLGVLFTRHARRCTLYASSSDKALAASQALQKYPRAGQSGEGLVIIDGVDTIDATNVDTGLMSHSYFADRSSIVSDIFQLIRDSLPPGQRQLFAVDAAAGRYWVFGSGGL